MPRSRSRSQSVPLTSRRNQSLRSPPTPPPSPVGPTGPSMLDSLKHGMGVGAGLEISRQLIQGITGVATGSASAPVSPTNKPCDILYDNMMTCIQLDDSCETHIESYRKCMSQ